MLHIHADAVMSNDGYPNVMPFSPAMVAHNAATKWATTNEPKKSL